MADNTRDMAQTLWQIFPRWQGAIGALPTGPVAEYIPVEPANYSDDPISCDITDSPQDLFRLTTPFTTTPNPGVPLRWTTPPVPAATGEPLQFTTSEDTDATLARLYLNDALDTLHGLDSDNASLEGAIQILIDNPPKDSLKYRQQAEQILGIAHDLADLDHLVFAGPAPGHAGARGATENSVLENRVHEELVNAALTNNPADLDTARSHLESLSNYAQFLSIKVNMTDQLRELAPSTIRLGETPFALGVCDDNFSNWATPCDDILNSPFYQTLNALSPEARQAFQNGFNELMSRNEDAWLNRSSVDPFAALEQEMVRQAGVIENMGYQEFLGALTAPTQTAEEQTVFSNTLQTINDSIAAIGRYQASLDELDGVIYDMTPEEVTNYMTGLYADVAVEIGQLPGNLGLLFQQHLDDLKADLERGQACGFQLFYPQDGSSCNTYEQANLLLGLIQTRRDVIAGSLATLIEGVILYHPESYEFYDVVRRNLYDGVPHSEEQAAAMVDRILDARFRTSVEDYSHNMESFRDRIADGLVFGIDDPFLRIGPEEYGRMADDLQEVLALIDSGRSEHAAARFTTLVESPRGRELIDNYQSFSHRHLAAEMTVSLGTIMISGGVAGFLGDAVRGASLFKNFQTLGSLSGLLVEGTTFYISNDAMAIGARLPGAHLPDSVGEFVFESLKSSAMLGFLHAIHGGYRGLVDRMISRETLQELSGLSRTAIRAGIWTGGVATETAGLTAWGSTAPIFEDHDEASAPLWQSVAMNAVFVVGLRMGNYPLNRMIRTVSAGRAMRAAGEDGRELEALRSNQDRLLADRDTMTESPAEWLSRVRDHQQSVLRFFETHPNLAAEGTIGALRAQIAEAEGALSQVRVAEALEPFSANPVDGHTVTRTTNNPAEMDNLLNALDTAGTPVERVSDHVWRVTTGLADGSPVTADFVVNSPAP